MATLAPWCSLCYKDTTYTCKSSIYSLEKGGMKARPRIEKHLYYLVLVAFTLTSANCWSETHNYVTITVTEIRIRALRFFWTTNFLIYLFKVKKKKKNNFTWRLSTLIKLCIFLSSTMLKSNKWDRGPVFYWTRTRIMLTQGVSQKNKYNFQITVHSLETAHRHFHPSVYSCQL